MQTHYVSPNTPAKNPAKTLHHTIEGQVCPWMVMVGLWEVMCAVELKCIILGHGKETGKGIGGGFGQGCDRYVDAKMRDNTTH